MKMRADRSNEYRGGELRLRSYVARFERKKSAEEEAAPSEEAIREATRRRANQLAASRGATVRTVQLPAREHAPGLEVATDLNARHRMRTVAGRFLQKYARCTSITPILLRGNVREGDDGGRVCLEDPDHISEAGRRRWGRTRDARGKTPGERRRAG